MEYNKTLNIKDKKFVANGNTYYIMDKISIERYAEYQMLMPMLTFGTSFDDIFKQLKNAYNHLNEKKFADSAVIIHNLLTTVANVEETKRVHPAVKMAALFINREGEDMGAYDEAAILEKCSDFTKEGYSINDFFSLSLNSIEGFKAAYLEYTEKKEKMGS